MALELNKLTGQVEAMGRAMAKRRDDHENRVSQARATLRNQPEVTAELREKIRVARNSDEWRRGAEPLGDRLDERYTPAGASPDVTLIATDGSQIYPDHHGIATYYLLNTGSIVLRQGSGQPPTVNSIPEIFYEDADLYDEAGQVHDSDYINSQRDHRELKALADLAEAERHAQGGDLSRPILALADGPLLPWLPQNSNRDNTVAEEIRFCAHQLKRLKNAGAIPVGYVDRPGSAYVLRILELINLPLEEINRDTLRFGPFVKLTDRLLFADLAPKQRTGLFAAISKANERYQQVARQRIVFFYMNVSQHDSTIARVEVPEWVAHDSAKLDLVQQALYTNSELTGYPYVLARAHELAVVGSAERADFETMLGQSMLRNKLVPETSLKALNKRWMHSGGRS